MTGLSQSQFLQALGWATLNSFWQMAVLWCLFLVANQLFNLTANKKYIFSIASITVGFACFIASFFIYFKDGNAYQVSILDHSLISSSGFLPVLLTTASVTYLALLIFPAYRLFKNWQFIRAIRQHGLQKIDVQYKLFVKKVAGRLGIKQNVAVYISELVKSPLTIGYLKPIILLPIASLNNLTIQQTEAVLLHELSHIKRYDYVINLLICIAHTFLYFNPFVRLFIKIAEEERENCCDAMVLQFGYDKLGYASALLNLEKLAIQNTALALEATGKKNLLNRIEKIVGLEKKPVFRFTHLAGLVAALLCIFAVNSMILTVQEERTSALSFTQLASPFYFLSEEKQVSTPLKTSNTHPIVGYAQKTKTLNVETHRENEIVPPPIEAPAPPDPVFLRVAFDEKEAALSEKEKENVKKTVETTKKVLRTVQWKEVEKEIGEVMTKEEKRLARKEYLQEIDKIDWKNLEENLKAGYEKIDWDNINTQMKTALADIQLDSIQHAYELMLVQIDKLTSNINCQTDSSSHLPFPDESLKALETKKALIHNTLHRIQTLRYKDVIKL